MSELSQETGISRNALSSLDRGIGKGVNYSTLEALCKYFNCDVGDILKFEDTKEE
ncbi:helix-turn-helix domain-containing protein [Rummeliibacillus suwonensis]|uniref:helix-turn-helix domain-containing protein n=1 Tax=Rummeliibacillus suwonensis TaxID=1306154 RepID=UPI003C7B55CE